MTKINIELKEDQKIFFTSDTHLGHNNVIKFSGRPYENVQEMGDDFIAKWNEVVSENDYIFHLGDFSWFNGTTDIYKIISKLNGQIYIVPGNHDKEHKFDLCEKLSKFHLCSDIAVLYIRNIIEDKPQKALEVFLCHYPLMTWPHRHNYALQLFGHIHSGPTSKGDIDQDLPLFSYQYDCGVDNNEYTPIEIREVLRKLNYPNEDPLKLRKF